MHISQKLAAAERAGKPVFSFEFFPPKTEQGVQNLYERMDRMHDLGPAFIDVTWGAGGRSSALTCEMVRVAQSVFGFETCMHLTCTDMEQSKVDEALSEAYKTGCTNILALRGDPPREQEKWEAVQGGFQYARDLVAHIRKTYGNHFDIGVAGYPEGCDDNQDEESLLDHLKEKVDAGGTFIVTQMFYDVENFLSWVGKVRARGITIPIVPGIMPIQTFAAFLRRANWSNCRIPPGWTEALEPVKNDDAAVREVGKTLVAQMCQRILDAGIPALHFYTMNLAQSTRMTLEELGLISDSSTPQRTLPWRQSLGLNRRDEDVRPIFWKNRHKSYVARTQDWDEFPNGRWGDARSPAFGQLDTYDIGLKSSNEHYIKLWGEPKNLKDIAGLFVRFLQKDLSSLPWTDSPLSVEAEEIQAQLIDLNSRGFLTINSQPAVNGVPSNHAVFGWGPAGGYCYQKSYLELLVPPELMDQLVQRIEKNDMLTYYAVNKAGDLRTNAPNDGPNAVTWGVFPGKEIVQPTIVEQISFLAWKDEAFRLGSDWARCHPLTSPARHLIDGIMENWYLVNIVNNDFHDTQALFDLFARLTVAELERVPESSSSARDESGRAQATTNGTTAHDSVEDSKSAAKGPPDGPAPIAAGLQNGSGSKASSKSQAASADGSALAKDSLLNGADKGGTHQLSSKTSANNNAKSGPALDSANGEAGHGLLPANNKTSNNSLMNGVSSKANGTAGHGADEHKEHSPVVSKQASTNGATREPLTTT